MSNLEHGNAKACSVCHRAVFMIDLNNDNLLCLFYKCRNSQTVVVILCNHNIIIFSIEGNVYPIDVS